MLAKEQEVITVFFFSSHLKRVIPLTDQFPCVWGVIYFLLISWFFLVFVYQQFVMFLHELSLYLPFLGERAREASQMHRSTFLITFREADWPQRHWRRKTWTNVFGEGDSVLGFLFHLRLPSTPSLLNSLPLQMGSRPLDLLRWQRYTSVARRLYPVTLDWKSWSLSSFPKTDFTFLGTMSLIQRH